MERAQVKKEEMRLLSRLYCCTCSRCIKIGALSIHVMGREEDRPVGGTSIIFESAGIRVHCTFACFA